MKPETGKKLAGIATSHVGCHYLHGAYGAAPPDESGVKGAKEGSPARPGSVYLIADPKRLDPKVQEPRKALGVFAAWSEVSGYAVCGGNYSTNPGGRWTAPDVWDLTNYLAGLKSKKVGDWKPYFQHFTPRPLRALGRIMIRLAELYPNSRFAGMDLSAEAIANARGEAAQKGLRNIEFTARDRTGFDRTAELASFDFITTFDAVHDQARPLAALKGIHRALRPDGLYLMQDIRGSSHVHKNVGRPLGTFLYTCSTMHCMTVSLAEGGEGLGAMWGEEKTRGYLEQAGFRSIETHQLAHDIANNWYVVRK